MLRTSRKKLSNPGGNLNDLKVSNSSCSFSNTGPSSSSPFLPSGVSEDDSTESSSFSISLSDCFYFFLLDNPLLNFLSSNTCWLGRRSRHLLHLRHLCHLSLLLLRHDEEKHAKPLKVFSVRCAISPDLQSGEIARTVRHKKSKKFFSLLIALE